jgi:hypothetical protein
MQSFGGEDAIGVARARPATSGLRAAGETHEVAVGLSDNWTPKSATCQARIQCYAESGGDRSATLSNRSALVHLSVSNLYRQQRAVEPNSSGATRLGVCELDLQHLLELPGCTAAGCGAGVRGGLLRPPT